MQKRLPREKSASVRTRLWRTVVAAWLTPLLAAQTPVAQTPAAQTSAPQAPAATVPAPPTEPGTLQIITLIGRDNVNNVKMPVLTTPVVEVRDQNDRPVEGVTVDFQLPLTGASGAFEDGTRRRETITNSQGQASAPYTPNTETGRFDIQVKATLGNRTGMALIPQRNATEAEAVRQPGTGFKHKKLVIVVAVIAAGAVVGIVLGTRGGSGSTSSNPTLTITPGIPTVGGPH